MKAATLGELKKQTDGTPVFRSVKDEVRANLMRKIERGEELFPGVVGYEESVIPSVVNALLSRHNMILLGLRGQAKSRILRGFVEFLDEEIACVEGCEIRDDPFFPICGVCRRRLREAGDDLPIMYVSRHDRYVEKLATPDVTIADMIGDLDPIKAARKGKDLADHENIHFGLLPRAHRGIFAINELPDLAPKIQVGLFNVMQEGDVQVKGFPIRLPLDVLMVFSANPEDYTARGKIVTPLKDRIGSEIRTHYPETLEHGMRITENESWSRRGSKPEVVVPVYIREIVELIAFEGRQDKRIDRRSGVSQRLPISCLENSISNAERRALICNEESVVVRVADIYAAVPAITGKLELEYEGELKGADVIARQLISGAVLKSFQSHFPGQEFEQIVQWFELGGEVKISDMTPSTDYLREASAIQGLVETIEKRGVDPVATPSLAASTIEFLLEGLCAQRKISRDERRGYHKKARKAEEEFFGDLKDRRRTFN